MPPKGGLHGSVSRLKDGASRRNAAHERSGPWPRDGLDLRRLDEGHVEELGGAPLGTLAPAMYFAVVVICAWPAICETVATSAPRQGGR